MDNLTPKCAECAFYKEHETDIGRPKSGDCRFNPPKLHLVPVQNPLNPREQGLQAVPMVPQVAADFWCGQFQDTFGFWAAEESPEPSVQSEFDKVNLIAKMRAGYTPTLEEAQAFRMDLPEEERDGDHEQGAQ